MKFYDCATAPSPRRVRIFAAEKGIDLETVQVDLSSGEQFSDEYQAINPDCVVPALVLDDGTCLSEVTAICQYLEEFKPEPTLWGNNATERAMATAWNAKAEQQGLTGMAEAFRNSTPGLKGRALPGPDGYEQIPELAERGRQRVQNFFEKLDGQLADNEFVAGSHFSIADITALVFVDFAKRARIKPPESLANLARWYAAVSSRPSAAA
ncbi:MAG: glutathione S-transferase [Woeseiaceae bacterium]|nr:glutathione S-transferase [Woeseiaceae bacterium]